MLETEVQSLDPQVATDGTSFEVIADYTDGLMQMDPKYIKNQLQQDQIADQLSFKEFVDPFTGSKETKA